MISKVTRKNNVVLARAHRFNDLTCIHDSIIAVVAAMGGSAALKLSPKLSPGEANIAQTTASAAGSMAGTMGLIGPIPVSKIKQIIERICVSLSPGVVQGVITLNYGCLPTPLH